MSKNFEKEGSIYEILLRGKYLLLTLFILIGTTSYYMAKKHPKQVSKGREYHSLYSMLEMIQNGREVAIGKIEKRLEGFSGFYPYFDNILLKKFIKNKDELNIARVFDRMKSRIVIPNRKSELFSEGSIYMDMNDTENFEKNHEMYEEIAGSSYVLCDIYRLCQLKCIYKKANEKAKLQACIKKIHQKLKSIEPDAIKNSYFISQVRKKVEKKV